MKPSAAPRKIVVIGGGPAGMEAARCAAERGHRVVLFERASELGGMSRVAARAPGRADLAAIPRWLAAQLEKLQVDVRLGREASVESIRAEEPARVIVATGADPTGAAIDAGHAGLAVVSVHAVISGAARPGRNVLVIDHTGKHLGCAAAELVADQGGRAQVVSRLFHPAVDFGLTNTVSLYRRLFRKGVVLKSHHELRSIEHGIVTLSNCYSGAEHTVEDLDMVIVATPPQPNDRLVSALRAAGIEPEAIGDCIAPRDIETAIFEGHRAAVAL